MTELIRNPRSVFSLLSNGPVVIASASKPTAVLLSVNEWDNTAKRLAYLERLVVGDQAIARDDFVTSDELAEAFAKMGIS